MNTTRNTSDISVSETGAHGPPRRRRPLVLLAALGVAVSGLISPMAAAQASPAPPPPPVAASAPAADAAGDDGLQNAAKGTRVTVNNDSNRPVTIGDKTLRPHSRNVDSITLKGASGSGDDISTTLRIGDGKAVPFYGHNPVSGGAYLQVGGQKIYDTSSFRESGVQLDVEFLSGNITFKGWFVTVTNNAKYDYDYIRHTDNEDGVKGFIRNQSSVPVTFQTHGFSAKLAPGEKVVMFDSHPMLDRGKGGSFTVSSAGDPGYSVEAADPPSMFDPFPRVVVRQAEGTGYNRTDYYEGEEHHFEFGRELKLTVKREDDNKLGVPFETRATSDWANFTWTITNR